MERRRNVSLYRQQIERIIQSPEFASSRQARDFLSFTSEAAFQAREELDQTEIAVGVLHRDNTFNPVDDTSVRKLASATRQRLQQYYTSRGSADPILVTLPHRTYIPQFRVQAANGVAEPQEITAAPVEVVHSSPRAARPKRWIWVGGMSAVVVLGIALAVSLLRKPVPGRFVLQTKGGDIAGRLTSGTNGLYLGVPVASDEDVTARMRFTPTAASQHAGIMFFEGPDQYVKLGRRFWSRVELEWGVEEGGAYRKPPGTFSYDTRGQDGTPVWLSLRRQDGAFRAFRSSDGMVWQRIGGELPMAPSTSKATMAVYAMQAEGGEVRPAEVEFDHLGVGPTFHDRPDGPTDLKEFTSWKSNNRCDGAADLRFVTGTLQYSFTPDDSKCSWSFTRSAPQGDWSVSTKIDMLNFDGASAGLELGGKKKLFRIVRWGADGGTIVAQSNPGGASSVPDFKGSPPLWFRIECLGGNVTASFSRDDSHYTRLPIKIAASEIGDDARVGLHVSRHSWAASETLPVVRFYYASHDVLSLMLHR